MSVSRWSVGVQLNPCYCSLFRVGMGFCTAPAKQKTPPVGDVLYSASDCSGRVIKNPLGMLVKLKTALWQSVLYQQTKRTSCFQTPLFVGEPALNWTLTKAITI